MWFILHRVGINSLNTWIDPLTPTQWCKIWMKSNTTDCSRFDKHQIRIRYHILKRHGFEKNRICLIQTVRKGTNKKTIWVTQEEKKSQIWAVCLQCERSLSVHTFTLTFCHRMFNVIYQQCMLSLASGAFKQPTKQKKKLYYTFDCKVI